MKMAGGNVGEEWTWNIVIETMKKLSIEIQPSDTEQSGEERMEIKQKEKSREASPGCSAASQAPSYPVQIPPEAGVNIKQNLSKFPGP